MVAVIADVIAADARASAYSPKFMKTATPADFEKFLEQHEYLVSRCATAVKSFETDQPTERFLADLSEILEALQQLDLE
jgi:hypothetical protein